MNGFAPESPLADLLRNPRARAVVASTFAGLADSPSVAQLAQVTIGRLVQRDPALQSDSTARERFWRLLADIDPDPPPRDDPPVVGPDPGYERDDVARASARLAAPAHVRLYEPIEIGIDGPSHGNPFVDVDLTARFTRGDTVATAGGFYDGDGRYVIRFLPERPGRWEFAVSSTARSLDGLAGVVEVGEEPAGHGPVRVARRFHFAHADGTVHIPLGTTAYGWAHQEADLRERTLHTLASSPFTKIRMTVFPKHYLYAHEDPERFPFPRREDGSWDVERFDVEFFRAFERCIIRLGELGIEADVILLHPYDRWGFADLGHAVDDRYLRYVVRRLAAYPNVWWSMANEYDLLASKTLDDWERMGRLVAAEDPTGHLLSIHNGAALFDHTRPWITHCSVQRTDVYRTAENVLEWRQRYGKPVLVDECGYEGDLDQGWGSLTGEELVRRSWEGAVRGGYVGHGETYYRDDEVIWWAKGGELSGSSPPRLEFLRRVIGEVPGGVIEPLPSEWDAPWAGVAGEHLLVYFGVNRPRFRRFTLPDNTPFEVDVVDTWNLTVDTLPGTYSGSFVIPLPGRQYIAVRLRAVPS
ncbi:MAG: DUF5605 domain-containing protein [Dermatophilaceae bacterium]